jgi:hypothetical protein
VAPTPAEYRVLGTNDAFLATLRVATGGRAIETAAEPWTHDLTTNASSTDLWPTLLILALLLWPLDIALRRVSVGRRELADARRWLSGGWRRTMAPRTTEVAGMLAARDRASGSVARAALLRDDDAPVDAPRQVGPPSRPAAPAARPVPSSLTSPAPPAPPPPLAQATGSVPATTSAPDASTLPDDGDTLSRLRDAKRRARER